jgi:hypothetical protein
MRLSDLIDEMTDKRLRLGECSHNGIARRDYYHMACTVTVKSQCFLRGFVRHKHV